MIDLTVLDPVSEPSATALLVLADGTVLRGEAFGARGTAIGEVVFNTGMTGYQEVMTDPSYSGQLVTFTYPELGNTGVNPQDQEANRPHVKGLITRRLAPVASNWRATEDLERWLQRHGVVGIRDVDTRALVRHLREGGSINGAISSEGLSPSPYGPLLGPFANALYTCGGAGSIGLTMPALSLLGPGSPVLVGGALGWVIGAGSGHQPLVKRQASGHALSPGCCAAVSVDLHALQTQWVRACFFEGHGSALLVAIAAAVPLIDASTAQQAAIGHDQLSAPVLDLSIPRRLKPSLGMARYSELVAGQWELPGSKQAQQLRCAPAHSPQLANSAAAELVRQLENGLFPLRLPLQPLSQRPSLVALEA